MSRCPQGPTLKAFHGRPCWHEWSYVWHVHSTNNHQTGNTQPQCDDKIFTYLTQKTLYCLLNNCTLLQWQKWASVSVSVQLQLDNKLRSSYQLYKFNKMQLLLFYWCFTNCCSLPWNEVVDWHSPLDGVVVKSVINVRKLIGPYATVVSFSVIFLVLVLVQLSKISQKKALNCSCLNVSKNNKYFLHFFLFLVLRVRFS